MMLAHHHKLAMTTTTTRVGIEKTRALGRGLSRRRVSNPRYVFLKKNYYIYLIFTPTPPTSPSLQPNLRPHQHVEAATQEWQQQQGLDVLSCRYVFFKILFLISYIFFRYTETVMGAAAAHDTQPPPPPTSLQPSPRPP